MHGSRTEARSALIFIIGKRRGKLSLSSFWRKMKARKVWCADYQVNNVSCRGQWVPVWNASLTRKSSKMAFDASGLMGVTEDLAKSHLSLVLQWACRAEIIQVRERN